MRPNDADRDPGWTERLKRAGVCTDLLESMSDDYDWIEYEASVLQAARDSVLSDDDLYRFNRSRVRRDQEANRAPLPPALPRFRRGAA